MLDREGNLFVHEARKRSFDMRFEECEIAPEARALPVTCVQPSKRIQQCAQLIKRDRRQHVGKACALQCQIAKQQRELLRLRIICAAEAERRFDRSEEHTSELQSLMRNSYAD